MCVRHRWTRTIPSFSGSLSHSLKCCNTVLLCNIVVATDVFYRTSDRLLTTHMIAQRLPVAFRSEAAAAAITSPSSLCSNSPNAARREWRQTQEPPLTIRIEEKKWKVFRCQLNMNNIRHDTISRRFLCITSSSCIYFYYFYCPEHRSESIKIQIVLFLTTSSLMSCSLLLVCYDCWTNGDGLTTNQKAERNSVI